MSSLPSLLCKSPQFIEEPWLYCFDFGFANLYSKSYLGTYSAGIHSNIMLYKSIKNKVFDNYFVDTFNLG